MQIRLWFWTRENPVPHVIDSGSGHSMLSALRNSFVPVDDTRLWKIVPEIRVSSTVKTLDPTLTSLVKRPGILIVRRDGNAGYFAEEIPADNPEGRRIQEAPRKPPNIPPIVTRKRLFL
jgi:hypothetical protein